MKRNFLLSFLSIMFLVFLSPFSANAQRPQRTIGEETEFAKITLSQMQKKREDFNKRFPLSNVRQIQHKWTGKKNFRNATKHQAKPAKSQLKALPLYTGPDGPVLWGNVVGQSTWETLEPENYPYGVYQFMSSCMCMKI